MKTLKYCFLVWSIMGVTLLSAQDLQNYKPLQSAGILPKEFRTTTYEQVANQQAGIAKETGNTTTQKDLENFYLESNYALDELLRSGQVLYNDPVGDYVNDVVDQILKDQPALRKKLSVFVVKSPVANAFTHQRGVILVNTGLIARLETEAQLAFILCHEIAHYMLDHSQDIYLKTKDLQYGRGEYRKQSVSDRLLTRSAYSRENETEADMEGLKLYLKTGYTIDNIADVFLLLENAEQPQTPLITYSSLWPESFLNDSSMLALIEKNLFPKVKKKADESEEASFITGFEDEAESEEEEVAGGLRPVKKPDEIAEVEFENEEKVVENDEADEDEDTEYDEYDTHPAASERKKIIEDELARLTGTDDKSLFLVSPARFTNLRTVSQFESCVLFLRSSAYFDALYQALVLKQEGETSPYLDDMIGKALYGIAKYKFDGETYPKIFEYVIDRNIPGSDLYKRLRRFDMNDILWLAFDYNYQIYQSDTTDIHRKAILTDLLIDVQYLEKDGGLTDFFEERNAASRKDENLTEIWEEAARRFDRLQLREEFFSSSEGIRFVNKWQSNITKKGYKLGIDKIVVFDPLFLRNDERKEQSTQFVSSEQQQIEIKEMLERSANKLDLDITILDSKISGKEISAEYWNEIELLNRWHKEILNQEVGRIVS
ncbi:MAG: M48 family metallopeptidase, partial [Bacteroidota bacterium]